MRGTTTTTTTTASICSNACNPSAGPSIDSDRSTRKTTINKDPKAACHRRRTKRTPADYANGRMRRNGDNRPRSMRYSGTRSRCMRVRPRIVVRAGAHVVGGLGSGVASREPDRPDRAASGGGSGSDNGISGAGGTTTEALRKHRLERRRAYYSKIHITIKSITLLTFLLFTLKHLKHPLREKSK